MANDALDELGPVDFVIIEFPAGKADFTGEAADELAALIETGTIRLIDLLILTKDDDGNVEALELADLDDLGPFEALEAELAEFLAEDDVEHLAAAMDPGFGRRCDRLREPVGGAVRIGCSPRRRTADRQRSDPRPGHHRGHRGGRSTRRTRSLTCHYDQDEGDE